MGAEAIVLTEGGDMELWYEYRREKNVELRNQLVLRHEYIVKSIAVQIVRKCHMEGHIDDLVSEGIIALIDAVEKYDPDRNVKFVTFATIKVRGAMIDFFRKQSAGYTRKAGQKAKMLREAEEVLTGQLQREPTRAEMASFLNLTADQFDREEKAAETINLISYEQVIEDYNYDHILFDVPSAQDGNPEDSLISADLCADLAGKIKKLNQQQQLVLSLYYMEELEIREIAEVLRIDPTEVSQIRFQAVRRLKRSMKQGV